MTFDPYEFINISRSLDTANKSEGEYRTAVSRAYYGILLLAREELLARGKIPKIVDRTVHHKVSASFNFKPYRHDGVRSRLDSLYRDRVIADYEVEPKIGQKVLKRSLNKVDYILDVFTKALFTKPPS